MSAARSTRVRRFVLVAAAVTGALTWLSIPLQSPYGRWYPLAGLVAAIASAATAWAPRFASSWLARLVLAGCVSFGVLMFAALAFRDLADMGVGTGGGRPWLAVVVWLASIGLVGQLVIPSCRPRDIYAGMALSFCTVTPFLPDPRHDVASRMLGIWLIALLPLIVAAITAAIQRRVTRSAALEIAGARVIS